MHTANSRLNLPTTCTAILLIEQLASPHNRIQNYMCSSLMKYIPVETVTNNQETKFSRYM